MTTPSERSLASQTVTQQPVDALTPYHRNPRRGDIPAIAESLSVLGQYRPIVVNKGTHTGRADEVLAGNHTLYAARELGWETVDCVTVDVDDDTAARIVVVDNRTSDLATNDDEILAALLSDLPDLPGTGFTDADLDALLASTSRLDELQPGLDDAPPLEEEVITEPGNVWHLGPHRLLCGDSTDAGVVETLFDGAHADCMWTDPPYGVEYVGKTKDALTFDNDEAGGVPVLLQAGFAAASKVLTGGAPVYIAHPAGPLSRIFWDAFVAAGWQLRQNLVWVKDTMVLGRSDYHYRHEPILYGFVPGGKGRLGRGGARWYGDHAQTSVIEVPKPARSSEHPTMKPVELVARCIANSCRPRGLIFDPFAGSGSTLIAAHATGCKAYVVEVDPQYCDVICRRWQTTSGQRPRLEGAGERDFAK